MARTTAAPASKTRLRTTVIAAVVGLVIIVVGGVAYYLDLVAPFRAPIVVVDGDSIPMRYFLKRVLMDGSEPMVVLQNLLREAIVKKVAPQPPYNIKVGEAEIDQYLRRVARGGSETISEKEYREWIRQQLNESRFSLAEFRDLARTLLMIRKLSGYLARKAPQVAEQVHLFMIPVNDLATAKEAKERLKAGEDFHRLAAELSSDESLKAKGGDLGWLPRSALSVNLAQTVFELPVGKASEPISLDAQHFAIVMVAEKAAAREIGGEALERIEAGALEEWMKNELRAHQVEFRGLYGKSYDSQTDDWVRWQVQRMKK
jgi:parvulin-like peptidyl-prolyl isomerase